MEPHLTAAMVCLAALLTASSATVEAAVEIVHDPRAGSPEPVDVGRRFGTAACERRRSVATILEALPDARTILVHQFDGRVWRSFDAVKDYVGRLLSAVPEGNQLSPTVHWAEMRMAEILASVEFTPGDRRPFRVANGYAHLQDSEGCEWWARYLGPDRSKWVVRP